MRAVRFWKNSYPTRAAVPGMFVFYLLDLIVVFDPSFFNFFVFVYGIVVFRHEFETLDHKCSFCFYVIDLFPFVSSFVWIFIRSFLQVNLIFVSCLG